MPYKNRIRTSAAVQQWARERRQEQTPAERILWDALRRKRLGGIKFRRQHPLGPYIVDFCCPALRLVIELDGEIHAMQQEEDQVRTEQLGAFGYRVLRFQNEQVLNHLNKVLECIERACQEQKRLPK